MSEEEPSKVYSLSTDKKSSDITRDIINGIMEHGNVKTIPDDLEYRIYEIIFTALYVNKQNLFDCTYKCCRK